MEKDWVLVYSVSKSYQSELCLELLQENEITGVVINKKDTSYASFGEFEIYVSGEVSEKARDLLQKSGM
jgi:hypothetical protein